MPERSRARCGSRAPEYNELLGASARSEASIFLSGFGLAQSGQRGVALQADESVPISLQRRVCRDPSQERPSCAVAEPS